MELQFETKQNADKLNVFVVCPGLSKDDLTVTFDKKEGILEVIGVPRKEEVSEIIDLEIKGNITISPKFRSEKPVLKVEHGIATIQFDLAKDVTLIKAE